MLGHGMSAHQTQKARGPYFIRVPLRILSDSRFTPLEKLLVGVAGGRGNASHEMLAAELGTGQRNVRKMVAHLRALGALR